ncbi:ABC transporter ATP-binding protein [Telmatospirillum siberiense]|uniref:ABC transporter ATP-binding protein n=1 Tax=Telmatospirillum siberiense TaxID=382514 RepID=A0A2N3PVD0_9PROT|nr:ABC transporter ATP-binding protein [Telmatospirillum siberiense]PKU24347.1 ABC transporter ATP-binding protein [Telmatospirillum siberiense]
MTGATVTVTEITKRWGETLAVAGVSLSAGEGRFVTLLGPSGCGKSTTLRVIAGLETVDGGSVRIGDRDVTRLPPSRRALSMVFQSYALFPHMTVAENLLFGLKVRKVAPVERRRRLTRVAELLSIDGLLSRKPSQLSGGQQQRVALGRALIAEAPVCLMDEPLSNLDAQLRGEMRREIRALQERLGITMIYVTHDQAEAMSMSDHVVLMNRGAIEQQGRPGDLYNRPASLFTARFIGSPAMDILDLSDPDLSRFVFGDPEKGAGLLLGLRPETVSPAPGHGLPAVVEASEYLGADTLLSCRAAGGQRLSARLPGAATMAPGTGVNLTWPEEATHLFNAADGRRRDDRLSDCPTAFTRARLSQIC